MNNIFVILNAMHMTVSEIGLKKCLYNFIPKVDKYLEQVGINVETTRKTNPQLGSHNNITEMNGIQLIFNGYLYNRKRLNMCCGINELEGNSDMKVIINLYIKYGIEYTVTVIDGRFSFVIIDNRTSLNESRMFVVQDKSGTLPIYMLKGVGNQGNDNNKFAISSEKQNIDIVADWLNGKSMGVYTDILSGDDLNESKEISKLKYETVRIDAGTYISLVLPMTVSAVWRINGYPTIYDKRNSLSVYPDMDWNVIFGIIDLSFLSFIVNRLESCKGMVSCLIDHTIGSVSLAKTVVEYCKSHNLPKIHTYSVHRTTLNNSRVDVSEIDSIHTEIIISENLYDAINKKFISVSCLNANSDKCDEVVCVDNDGVRWIFPEYIADDCGNSTKDERLMYEENEAWDDYVNYIVGKQIVSDCHYLYPDKEDVPKLALLSLGASVLTNEFSNNSLYTNIIEYDIAFRERLVYDSNVTALSCYKFMESGNNIQCAFPYLDNGFVTNILLIPPELRNQMSKKTDIMGMKMRQGI